MKRSELEKKNAYLLQLRRLKGCLVYAPSKAGFKLLGLGKDVYISSIYADRGYVYHSGEVWQAEKKQCSDDPEEDEDAYFLFQRLN